MLLLLLMMMMMMMLILSHLPPAKTVRRSQHPFSCHFTLALVLPISSTTSAVV